MMKNTPVLVYFTVFSILAVSILVFQNSLLSRSRAHQSEAQGLEQKSPGGPDVQKNLAPDPSSQDQNFVERGSLPDGTLSGTDAARATASATAGLASKGKAVLLEEAFQGLDLEDLPQLRDQMMQRMTSALFDDQFTKIAPSLDFYLASEAEQFEKSWDFASDLVNAKFSHIDEYFDLRTTLSHPEIGDSLKLEIYLNAMGGFSYSPTGEEIPRVHSISGTVDFVFNDKIISSHSNVLRLRSSDYTYWNLHFLKLCPQNLGAALLAIAIQIPEKNEKKSQILVLSKGKPDWIRIDLPDWKGEKRPPAQVAMSNTSEAATNLLTDGAITSELESSASIAEEQNVQDSQDKKRSFCSSP